jgi:hypothetical protein
MSSTSISPVTQSDGNEGLGVAFPAAITPEENRTRPNESDSPFLVGPKENKVSQGLVTTDFRAFPDGSIAELVYCPTINKSQLGFLIWNSGKATLVDHFDHEGFRHTPPVLDVRVLENLNLSLPSEVKACPTPAEFFLEVSELIRSHLDLPEASIHLVAAFVFSTWFIDKLAVAPYLWISGPPGSGKTTLLRVLQCLCRRSVLFAGSIPSRVYPLPGLLRPTLLLDELQFHGEQLSYNLES